MVTLCPSVKRVAIIKSKMRLQEVKRIFTKLNQYSNVIKKSQTMCYCTSREHIDQDSSLLTQKHYDIIVAGGGMVGFTLACALAKNEKLTSQKILLLERSPEMSFTLKDEYSNRVSALNMRTKSLMSRIGVWEHVEKLRCKSIKKMQVWDGSSDASIYFNSDIVNNSLAYIVENDVLLHAVYKELCSENVKNPVEIINNARIKNYDLAKSSTDASKVLMENGDVYSCSLLIGADGAASAVRKAMSTDYISWSYHQMGVVATLNLNQDPESHNDTAWQRFLPDGPVALLPLSNTHSSLVWSTTPGKAKDLVKMDEADFVNAVNQAFCQQFEQHRAVQSMMGFLSNVISSAGLANTSSSQQLPPAVKSVAANSRAAFPLGFGHSTRYVADGVALVGDAAHRVHPLAGQGVNLGFGDVDKLVEVVSDAVYRGGVASDKHGLLRYESDRQRQVVMMSSVIDGLHRIYGTQWLPIVAARSAGVQLLQSCPPLKRLVMQQAMS